jgi:hypothetical protein
MARTTRSFIHSVLFSLSVATFAGVALAEPAAPTHTASPTAEASRYLRSAVKEVTSGVTPSGAKRGLAIAAARIERGYQQFLADVHAPTFRR